MKILQVLSSLRLTVPCLTISLGFAIDALVLPSLVLTTHIVFWGVIYYWTTYRPDLISLLFIAAIGLISDCITNLPLGLTSLVFLLTYWMILTQRRHFYRQTFAITWLGFVLITTMSSVLIHLLSWLSIRSAIELVPMLLGILLATFLYPPVARSLVIINRWIPLVR